MKTIYIMLTKTLMLLFIISSPFVSSAQLGGLLKKAKDKVSEKANNHAATSTIQIKNTTNVANATSSNSTNSSVSSQGDDCDIIRQKRYATTYLNFKLESDLSKGFNGYDPERFLEYAQKLDYPSLQAMLEKSANCTSNTSDIEFLQNFGDNFLKDFKENGMQGFNHMIDKAYGYIGDYNKYKDPLLQKNSFEWIDAAIIQINATKLILPKNKDVLEMEAEIIKAEMKIKGDVKKKEAAIATSPIHLKYIDKIVFSSKPIILGKENELEFKTSFKPGEKIYGVAYLKAGIKDLLGGAAEDQQIYATVSIDGEGVFGRGSNETRDNKVGRKLTIEEVDRNIAAWTFELSADENTTTSSIPWIFAEMIENLSPRKHKVALQMGAWNNGGSFEIDLDGVDLTKQLADAKAYSIKAEDIIASKRTIPEAWKAYTKKSFNDASLNVSNMKAVLKENYSDLVDVLRIVILAQVDWQEWEIIKNELDIPKYMTTPSVGVVYKGKDGNCYFTKGNFYKEYMGGGKYGKMKANCFSGGKEKIGCANVNK